MRDSARACPGASAPTPCCGPLPRRAALRLLGGVGAWGALAPAGALAAFAVPPASPAAPAVRTERRAPAVKLEQRLPRLLAACGLPPSSLGLQVCALDSGQTVASMHAEQPFVLASTAKVVTSLAALDLLGAHWRWRTLAFATGPIQRGRLLGDLMIVGGGDPSLTRADLRRWLAELQAGGLRDIGGDLIVDHSAFHLLPADHAGTPEPASDRPHHAWPDGLLLDEAAAAPRTGQPTSAPPPSAPQPPVARLSAALQPPVARRSAALQPPVARRSAALQPSVARLSAALVDDAAAQALLQTWLDLGGRLSGRVRAREFDPAAEHARLPVFGRDGLPLPPLSARASAPLAEVLQTINKTSHNLAARHLMLSLARGFPVQAATLPAARQRVQQWLQRQRLTPADLVLDNGSGLSRAERARPRALVQLLRSAWTGPHARVFVQSLPVAGVDGTLAHRLQGGAAMGQAFLKTGTLLDTRALAGYVRAHSGRDYALATFAHHPQAARARGAMDAVIETLARHG